MVDDENDEELDDDSALSTMELVIALAVVVGGSLAIAAAVLGSIPYDASFLIAL